MNSFEEEYELRLNERRQKLHLPDDTPSHLVEFIERASEYLRFREDVEIILTIRTPSGGHYDQPMHSNEDKEGHPYVNFSNGYITIKLKHWGDGIYSTLKSTMGEPKPYLYTDFDQLHKAGFRVTKIEEDKL